MNDHNQIQPKNSFYLRRSKSKKKQMQESVERVRTLHQLERDGLVQASLGQSNVTDSIKLVKRSNVKKANRRRQKKVQSNHESSSDSENEDIVLGECQCPTFQYAGGPYTDCTKDIKNERRNNTYNLQESAQEYQAKKVQKDGSTNETDPALNKHGKQENSYDYFLENDSASQKIT